MKATTTTAVCSECVAEWTVSGLTKGEIIPCPECGTERAVIASVPVALALAPNEDEEWGE